MTHIVGLFQTIANVLTIKIIWKRHQIKIRIWDHARTLESEEASSNNSTIIRSCSSHTAVAIITKIRLASHHRFNRFIINLKWCQGRCIHFRIKSLNRKFFAFNLQSSMGNCLHLSIPIIKSLNHNNLLLNSLKFNHSSTLNLWQINCLMSTALTETYVRARTLLSALLVFQCSRSGLPTGQEVALLRLLFNGAGYSAVIRYVLMMGYLYSLTLIWGTSFHSTLEKVSLPNHCGDKCGITRENAGLTWWLDILTLNAVGSDRGGLLYH